MKKCYTFIAICAMLFISSCSKPAINNDPVIGVWTSTNLNTISENNKSATQYEWIFNDAYLGRYHQYTNNNLVLKTDFKWRKENDIYTISYPGTDLSDDKVKLIVATLQKTNGTIFATRE